jgi:hypothetical protein
VSVTAIEFGTDHLQRMNQRLNGIDTTRGIDSRSIWPLDFPSAGPGGFIVDRPEDSDRNV